MSHSLEFVGPIEGYVVNYAKRHGWKVAATHELNDLRQEAYFVYDRVLKKYPEVKQAPHFMALFKTAWRNHFLDLANADTRERSLLVPMVTRDDEGREHEIDPVGESDNDGALATMIRQAPREVSAVLNLFISAPTELLDLALGAWNGPDKRKRAGGCEKINRMLGLPAHTDALQAVHDYFH